MQPFSVASCFHNKKDFLSSNNERLLHIRQLITYTRSQPQQKMSTEPVVKTPHIWTSYEVTWTPDPGDFAGIIPGDFWLIHHIERWLIDLVWLNTDDLSKVDKEWWIFHVTPGHVFIFLHLVVADLKPGIQTPLKLPVCGWSESPIPSCTSFTTEEHYKTFWDFHVKVSEMRLKPVFSEHHRRIVHREDKKKKLVL